MTAPGVGEGTPNGVRPPTSPAGDRVDTQQPSHENVLSRQAQQERESIKSEALKRDVSEVVRQEVIIGRLIQKGKVDRAEWNNLQQSVLTKQGSVQEKVTARKDAAHTIWEKQTRSVLLDASGNTVQARETVITNITELFSGDRDSAERAYSTYEQLIATRMAAHNLTEDQVDIDTRVGALAEALTSWTPPESQALEIEVKRFFFDNNDPLREERGETVQNIDDPRVFEKLCSDALARSVREDNGQIIARTAAQLDIDEDHQRQQRLLIQESKRSAGGIERERRMLAGRHALEEIRSGERFRSGTMKETVESLRLGRLYEGWRTQAGELQELYQIQSLVVLSDDEFNARLADAQASVDAAKGQQMVEIEAFRSAQDRLKWLQRAEIWRKDTKHRVNPSAQETSEQQRITMIENNIKTQRQDYSNALLGVIAAVEKNTDILGVERANIMEFLQSVQNTDPENNSFLNSSEIRTMAINEGEHKSFGGWDERKRKAKALIGEALRMLAAMIPGLIIGNVDVVMGKAA